MFDGSTGAPGGGGAKNNRETRTKGDRSHLRGTKPPRPLTKKYPRAPRQKGPGDRDGVAGPLSATVASAGVL